MAARIEGDTNVKFGGLLGAEAEAYKNGNMKALITDAVLNYDSSGDYWKLMEDGSLAYDGDGWLKDSNGNMILDENNKPIGAEGIEGGLAKILNVDESTTRRILRDSHFTDTGEEMTPWKSSDNNEKAIKLENKEYAQIYYKDLDQYNTLNIYNKLVESGMAPSVFDPSVNTSSSGEWNGRMQERTLSYEEWKANNFMSADPLSILATKTSAVGSQEVSSVYGTRIHPITGEVSNHSGNDTAVPVGTSFKPLADGIVSSITNTNYGGNTLTIAHELSYYFKGEFTTTTLYSEYLHLRDNSEGVPDILYNVGEYVSQNSVAGFTGNTGETTGPHIHVGMYFASSNPLLIWMQNNNYNLIQKDRGFFYNPYEVKNRR